MYARGFIPVFMQTKVKSLARYFTVLHGKALYVLCSKPKKPVTDIDHYDRLIISVSSAAWEITG